jgi:hypothetical protein
MLAHAVTCAVAKAQVRAAMYLRISQERTGDGFGVE